MQSTMHVLNESTLFLNFVFKHLKINTIQRISFTHKPTPETGSSFFFLIYFFIEG